jgi:hypothetical protein
VKAGSINSGNPGFTPFTRIHIMRITLIDGFCKTRRLMMDTAFAVFILTLVRLVLPVGLLIVLGTLLNGPKEKEA